MKEEYLIQTACRLRNSMQRCCWYPDTSFAI